MFWIVLGTNLKSSLLSTSASVICHLFSVVLTGISLRMFSENGPTDKLCSIKMLEISVSKLPAGPRLLTKWPLGYREWMSHESMRTTNLKGLEKEIGGEFQTEKNKLLNKKKKKEKEGYRKRFNSQQVKSYNQRHNK